MNDAIDENLQSIVGSRIAVSTCLLKLAGSKAHARMALRHRQTI